MVKVRMIRKQGIILHKVYRFDTNDEMNAMIENFAKNYKQSVTVLFNGQFSFRDMEFIKATADDEAYSDLDLSNGTPFIITKENFSLKSIDDEKKERRERLASVDQNFVKKSSRIKKIKPNLVANSSHWTNEQLGFLWAGTKEEVAKLVGKKPERVYAKRVLYIRDNPEFIIPDKCKTKRKSSKKNKVKVMDTNNTVAANKYKGWTNAEMALLWTAPINDLLDKLPGRTYGAIYQMRIKYYTENKDFVAPAVAKFKIPNNFKDRTIDIPPVEVQQTAVPAESVKRARTQASKNGWTEDELSKIWLGPLEHVEVVLGGKRTRGAILFQRTEFVKANPTFVIPSCAKYTPRNKNKMDEKIEKKADTKEVAQQIIQRLREPKPTPVVVQRPVSNVTEDVKDIVNKEMKDLAQLLNSLTVQPKKITVNGIQLEF